jgi:hypothetical protein
MIFWLGLYWKGCDFISKQDNQRYRKETGDNHKERAKDNNTGSIKDMPSREGYGDGDPTGCTNTSNKRSKWMIKLMKIFLSITPGHVLLVCPGINVYKAIYYKT